MDHILSISYHENTVHCVEFVFLKCSKISGAPLAYLIYLRFDENANTVIYRLWSEHIQIAFEKAQILINFSSYLFQLFPCKQIYIEGHNPKCRITIFDQK